MLRVKNISHQICTQFCFTVFCSGYIILFGRFIRITCSNHYSDVIMGSIASQITSLTIVYSTVYSGADQRTHQSSASMAFVWGIHRWLVNSPHKGPVAWKMFPFDDVIVFQDGFTVTGYRTIAKRNNAWTIFICLEMYCTYNFSHLLCLPKI